MEIYSPDSESAAPMREAPDSIATPETLCLADAILRPLLRSDSKWYLSISGKLQRGTEPFSAHETLVVLSSLKAAWHRAAFSLELIPDETRAELERIDNGLAEAIGQVLELSSPVAPDALCRYIREAVWNFEKLRSLFWEDVRELNS